MREAINALESAVGSLEQALSGDTARNGDGNRPT